eukprot:jgi/Bigna1/91754/estExt_fgenesh1_pg.C_1170009
MDGELLAPQLKEALKEIFHRFIPTTDSTSHPKLLAFCMGQKDSDSTVIDFFRDPLFESRVIQNVDVFLDESASWDAQTLARYLRSVNARDIEARVTAIMTRYGERHLLFHRSKASKFISEGSLRRGTCERSPKQNPAMYFRLNLEGFLKMYKDACKDRPVAVRSDLRESGIQYHSSFLQLFCESHLQCVQDIIVKEKCVETLESAPIRNTEMILLEVNVREVLVLKNFDAFNIEDEAINSQKTSLSNQSAAATMEGRSPLAVLATNFFPKAFSLAGKKCHRKHKPRTLGQRGEKEIVESKVTGSRENMSERRESKKEFSDDGKTEMGSVGAAATAGITSALESTLSRTYKAMAVNMQRSMQMASQMNGMMEQYLCRSIDIKSVVVAAKRTTSPTEVGLRISVENHSNIPVSHCTLKLSFIAHTGKGGEQRDGESKNSVKSAVVVPFEVFEISPPPAKSLIQENVDKNTAAAPDGTHTNTSTQNAAITTSKKEDGIIGSNFTLKPGAALNWNLTVGIKQMRQCNGHINLIFPSIGTGRQLVVNHAFGLYLIHRCTRSWMKNYKEKVGKDVAVSLDGGFLRNFFCVPHEEGIGPGSAFTLSFTAGSSPDMLLLVQRVVDRRVELLVDIQGNIKDAHDGNKRVVAREKFVENVLLELDMYSKAFVARVDPFLEAKGDAHKDEKKENKISDTTDS